VIVLDVDFTIVLATSALAWYGDITRAARRLPLATG
jgi:hypothetical protein